MDPSWRHRVVRIAASASCGGVPARPGPRCCSSPRPGGSPLPIGWQAQRGARVATARPAAPLARNLPSGRAGRGRPPAAYRLASPRRAAAASVSLVESWRVDPSSVPARLSASAARSAPHRNTSGTQCPSTPGRQDDEVRARAVRHPRGLLAGRVAGAVQPAQSRAGGSPRGLLPARQERRPRRDGAAGRRDGRPRGRRADVVYCSLVSMAERARPWSKSQWHGVNAMQCFFILYVNFYFYLSQCCSTPIVLLAHLYF